MNWDAIGAVAEILGAIAVIATLVYLSIQIRNNTTMTRASIRQARSDWGLQHADVFSNSDRLPEIMAGLENGEKLERADHLRWLFYTQAWHRNHENALLQQQDGLVDYEVMSAQARILKLLWENDSPYFFEWEDRKENFDPAYVEFVESLSKGDA